MPDAPSESKTQCHSIQGKIFNFVLGNDTRNVSVISHPWIAAGAEPDAHQFMSRFVYKRGDRMEANSTPYCSNSKTRLGMHGQMRS
jgi:hypothetical protein